MYSQLLLLLFAALVGSELTYFSDHRGIGIRNSQGEVCFLLSFLVDILNLNLPQDKAARETIDLADAILKGKCSEYGSNPFMSASFTHLNRTRTFTFAFKQASVMVDRYEQLRWVADTISYSETYAGRTVEFNSSESIASQLSSPLKQQFTCRDTINMTLTNEGYEPVQLFLLPPLSIQPYGLSSNIYLCEKTRRRSLSQSLETKSTIASGVVLLLSSIGVIVGHAVRRHFMPERKRAYDNLG